MNACRAAVRVCAVIGLCALSSDAWAQRETGPFGNLFGSQPGGDVNQSLSLRWSAYGGRDDVVRAVREIVASGLKPEEITEDTISRHLFTSGLPDPDLIVRTAQPRRAAPEIAERQRVS